MELALHGSQINLATRDKATATIPVNYPVLLKRPGSASVTLTTPSAQLAATNKLLLARAQSLQSLQPKQPATLQQLHQQQHQQQQHQQHQQQQTLQYHQPEKVYRRAASADFSKYRQKTVPVNSTKNSPRLASNVNKAQCNIQKDKTRDLSSSSLYKLLLAEPIKRNTWMSSMDELQSLDDDAAGAHADDTETNDGIDGSDEHNSSAVESNNDGSATEKIEIDNDSSSGTSIAEHIEEIGDNGNETANENEEIDDTISEVHEHGELTMENDTIPPPSPIATTTPTPTAAPATTLETTATSTETAKSISTKLTSENSIEKTESRPKSTMLANIRSKSKSLDLKQQQQQFFQKSGTVIKAKTSSPVNNNNKLKMAKEKFTKHVSILQSDGSREKVRTSGGAASIDSVTAVLSSSPPSSNSNDDKSNGNQILSQHHDNEPSKSIYVSHPTSPPPGAFNTVKTDLPGRVSFSKIGNDVYEIDYSDIDNDTDTSRTDEPFRKKNVHFEDEYFSNAIPGRYDISNQSMSTMNRTSGSSSIIKETTATAALATGEPSNNFLNDEKTYSAPIKCNSLRCKADVRLDVLPEDNENGSGTMIPNDGSEKIIEDYKREIESINRQHELERRWNGNKMNGQPSTSMYTSPKYMTTTGTSVTEQQIEASAAKDEWPSGGSDSWSSPNHTTPQPPPPQSSSASANFMGKSKAIAGAQATSNTSDDSPTRDSGSTVINNYLRITNQKISNSTATKPSSATIKLKTTKKLTATTNRKIKSAQMGSGGDAKSTTMPSTAVATNRLTKAKSVGHLHQQRVTDIKLNEFQIDKVESWMSTHEDTFSDAGGAGGNSGGFNSYRKYGKFGSSSNLDYKKTWRETPTSKTDDEGNYSLDDQVDNTSMDGSIGGGIELVLKKLEGRRMQISFDPIKSSTSAPSLSVATDGFQQKQNSTALTVANSLTDQSNKIKEIYQYLDEVDFNCDRTINNAKQQMIPDDFQAEICIDFNIENDSVGNVPKLSELMLLSNEQLARKIIGLALRTNELTNAIQLSKEHMDKIRCDNQKAIRMEKQMAQTRSKEQKNHYETIVTRHQEFIEQLLKDKASLCEKVAALQRRLESQSIAAEHKLQNEIQRIKETALAAEKIRRERWVRENTKKIKELTVKGLEQEISKITCNHQKEITELKRQHQEEILNAVEEARQKHESLEMSIRETYAKDREVAIEKERNAMRDRFENQMEHEQKSNEDSKNRILTEFSAEKDRLLKEIHQKERELEMQREKFHKDKKEITEQMNREFNEKMRMIEKRNQCELESISKQFESDFAIWKREHETAFKLRQIEEANAIRQQCRTERDKQIDSIVAKIDEETLLQKQDYEAKVARLKSQHESELRELERTERQTRDKYMETRSKLTQSEADAKNMQASINQLEIQLAHLQKMCDNFLTEKEHFKDAVRKERDDEIQEIHKRVQSAIEKKDESLDVIMKENASLKDRCIKLDAIVRQQRKDYCIK